MNYEVYKLIHLSGVFLILMSLATLGFHVLAGGTREFRQRKSIAAFHGTGMLLSLLGGFGMLAKLHLFSPMPTWVIGKLTIWLFLGGMSALILRLREHAKLWLSLTFLSTLTAAFLAIYKI